MNNALALLGGSPVRSRPFPVWPIYGKEEEQALLRTLHSGKWGKLDGAEVKTFERRFAQYCGAKHGVAVVNGTVSLRIALLAAGIEAGDEVIIPPYTFFATASAVVEANATPVFADIDPATFNIDPAAIEAVITRRTRAIIPVHLAGLPCDMDAIMAVAQRHGLVVIEDAAHAHGSEYKGKRVGALGHMGSFSFQSSKNLTSGEGGIIVTNDDALAERCRSIHNCGRVLGGAWYEHHAISGNYRLGEFAGAILNCQLDRLDEQTNTRDANGRYLDQHLAMIPGISPQKRGEAASRHAQHLYATRYDQGVFGVSRATLLDALAAEGIPASPGYVLPLHRQPMFLSRAFGPYTGYQSARLDLDFAKIALPNCERISSAEGVWLTQNVLLGTQADMDDVVRAFEKVYEHRHALAGVVETPTGAGS
ncbi:MAG TPA: DegT/DnrJ/EryC1/StrS family aminotransferase [Tepidisphaeraceae bacterium]|nr:DegT/DnrJ/EryC1/StrS family aminotransferase [Tepidisphaeraceae bacterium]